MSDHSADASLQEKCFPTLCTGSEMDTHISQDELESTSLEEPKKSVAITYFNATAKLTENSFSCDKSLDLVNSQYKVQSSVPLSKELAETEICSELLSTQNKSECINGEVNKSLHEDRINGLVHSFNSDKVLPNLCSDKTLNIELKQDSFVKSTNVVNHDQTPSNNVPVEINNIELPICNHDNFPNKSSFESDLKSDSEEECSAHINNCGDNLNDLISEMNEREKGEDYELEDNCTDGTGNSSPEHESYDATLDEVYHVPKNPIFNGSSFAERRSNLKRKAVDSGNGRFYLV